MEVNRASAQDRVASKETKPKILIPSAPVLCYYETTLTKVLTHTKKHRRAF